MRNRTGRRPGWKRWLLGALLSIVVLLIGGALLLLAIEWRPEPVIDTRIEGSGCATQPAPNALSLLSWNLGYAGLGRDADFFMDGGTQVRVRSEAIVRDNLAGILAFLKSQDSDILLLQEVDRNSSRTFGFDEAEPLASIFPGHCRSFAPNYKSAWVPFPFFKPLGRVESGLLSLSRFRPKSATRYQLPGAFPWPIRVFHLKRCLHELRIPAPDGHDWVIVHQHLSTFDKDGNLRRQEMQFLKEHILALREEGQHVIVGGDWNQSFPGVAERHFPATSPTPDWFQRVPDGWTPPGWQWAFDPNVPSLRAVDQAYTPGVNFLTIVDGFLLGPEIELRSVKTTDLGFANSDHHPVRLEVALREAR